MTNTTMQFLNVMTIAFVMGTVYSVAMHHKASVFKMVFTSMLNSLKFMGVVGVCNLIYVVATPSIMDMFISTRVFGAVAVALAAIGISVAIMIAEHDIKQAK